MKIKARYRHWEQRVTYLDRFLGHDGFSSSLPGPCNQAYLYLVDSHERGVISTDDAEAALEVIHAVTRTATPEQFDQKHPDNAFVLWMATLKQMDRAWMETHYRYLTNEIRHTYVSTCCVLDIKGLKAPICFHHYNQLLDIRDKYPASPPTQAAIHVIQRIYEDILIHLAYQQHSTRELVESWYGVDKDKTLFERALRDYQEDFHLYMSILHPEDEAPKPRSQPTLTSIRGGKH